MVAGTAIQIIDGSHAETQGIVELSQAVGEPRRSVVEINVDDVSPVRVVSCGVIIDVELYVREIQGGFNGIIRAADAPDLFAVPSRELEVVLEFVSAHDPGQLEHDADPAAVVDRAGGVRRRRRPAVIVRTHDIHLIRSRVRSRQRRDNVSQVPALIGNAQAGNGGEPVVDIGRRIDIALISDLSGAKTLKGRGRGEDFRFADLRDQFISGRGKNLALRSSKSRERKSCRHCQDIKNPDVHSVSLPARPREFSTIEPDPSTGSRVFRLGH